MLNLRRLFALSRVRSGNQDTLMLRLRIATVVLALYWLALFVSTHVPGGLHDGSHLIPRDKIAHLTGYTLLAFLLAWAAFGSAQMTIFNAVMLWGVVVSYAVVDELTQGLVPRRSPDVMDWIADAIGAVLGLAIFAVFSRMRRRRRQKDV